MISSANDRSNPYDIQLNFWGPHKPYFTYKESPYDNASIESLHATLKKEEVNHVQNIDYKSTKLALFQLV